MSILQATHIHKKFGSFTALKDLSISLNDGEILGLLGPNGAGKTTTIQILLGVLTPNTGEVSYFGKNFWQHREEILEQINFSSTYINLPYDLTVMECLKFVSYLYEIPNRKKRIEKIIALFNLEKITHKLIRELSAGQTTRVNLAKAFINFPKILLLDEPTASLDPDVAVYIRNFFLKQRKEFGMSMIWTSHNMAEVEEMCDRVIFINHGRIIANDTPYNLAKTIQICHLELLIRDGLKRTIDFCKRKRLKHRLYGRNIVIDLKDKNIPHFLHELMKQGIFYDEISIDKPKLEDYFMQMAQSKKLQSPNEN